MLGCFLRFASKGVPTSAHCSCSHKLLHVGLIMGWHLFFRVLDVVMGNNELHLLTDCLWRLVYDLCDHSHYCFTTRILCTLYP